MSSSTICMIVRVYLVFAVSSSFCSFWVTVVLPLLTAASKFAFTCLYRVSVHLMCWFSIGWGVDSFKCTDWNTCRGSCLSDNIVNCLLADMVVCFGNVAVDKACFCWLARLSCSTYNVSYWGVDDIHADNVVVLASLHCYILILLILLYFVRFRICCDLNKSVLMHGSRCFITTIIFLVVYILQYFCPELNNECRI